MNVDPPLCALCDEPINPNAGFCHTEIDQGWHEIHSECCPYCPATRQYNLYHDEGRSADWWEGES